MPRPVPPWTWRIALRDHGPDDRSLLLTLYVLGTFMGRDGTCFPSQQTIAKGSRVSDRTVRRQLENAQQLGWLGIETANTGGKGWRKNVYRCAVPDDVQLDEKSVRIAENLEAQDGAIAPLRADTMMTGRHTRADVQMSGRSNGSGHSPPISSTSAPRSGQTADRRAAISAPGADISSETSGHACPTNSRFNSPLNSQSELTQEEALAEARARAPLRKDSSRGKSPEEIQNQERKALALLVASPSTKNTDLQNWYGISERKAAELRKEAAAGRKALLEKQHESQSNPAVRSSQ